MAFIGGKLHPWFSTTPNKVALKNMVRVGTEYASEIAAANTPVESGYLRSNWNVTKPFPTMTFLGYGWQAEWENDSDYAAFVNWGTGLYGPEHRKYLIVPKRPGGSLHWVDRLTGEDRYAKYVWHPGSPGNHMLEISAGMLEANWTRMVKPVLVKWAEQVEAQNPWAKVT